MSLPTLSTQRLTLRQYTASEYDALRKLMSHPDVSTRVGSPTTEEAWQQLFTRFTQSHPKDRLEAWAVLLDQSKTYVGHVVLLPAKLDTTAIEIVYVIDPAHTGNGYATEAAGAVLDYAQTKHRRIIAPIDANHLASQQVAKNIGMHFEYQGNDSDGEYLVYALNIHQQSNEQSQLRNQL